MDDVRAAWDRRLDLHESVQAYHAFRHFRDLPARGRSLARAYTSCLHLCPRDRGRVVSPAAGAQNEASTGPEHLEKASGRWKSWRRRYLWDARAAEYDTFLEAQSREETLEAVREMNRRYATIARAATSKIVERLQSIKADDLSAGQVIVWLEKANHVERLSRGVPTSLVSADVATHALPPDLSALSDADLDQMQTFLERAGARRTER